jgi:hypothetical protein
MTEPITRRDFLRRGVSYSGAAVFAIPAVNVMSLGSAGASSGNSSYGRSGNKSRSNSRSRSNDSDPGGSQRSATQ